jgi:hypothetical protein
MPGGFAFFLTPNGHNRATAAARPCLFLLSGSGGVLPGSRQNAPFALGLNAASQKGWPLCKEGEEAMRPVLDWLFGTARPQLASPARGMVGPAPDLSHRKSAPFLPVTEPPKRSLAAPAVVLHPPARPAEPSGLETMNDVIRCFAEGTGVLTNLGERPVEALREGTRILTRDNGFQPLLWSGIRALSAQDAASGSDLRPIRLRKDAFGSGVPVRDLVVSAQHKLLISGNEVHAEYGEREALISAADLVERGQEVLPRPPVRRYVHLLFEQHEIIWANGAWTESFQPDQRAIGLLGGLHPATFATDGLMDAAAWQVAARPTVRPSAAI